MCTCMLRSSWSMALGDRSRSRAVKDVKSPASAHACSRGHTQAWAATRFRALGRAEHDNRCWCAHARQRQYTCGRLTCSVRVNALPCVATEVDLASTRDPFCCAPSSAAASGAKTGRPSSPDDTMRRVMKALQPKCFTGADCHLLAV